MTRTKSVILPGPTWGVKKEKKTPLVEFSSRPHNLLLYSRDEFEPRAHLLS